MCCFFPAFTAGPIDRLDRFVPELRSPLPLEDRDWLDAGGRIVVGLFKKFVISDLLAVISISDGLVPYVRAAGWMWIFLYAYSLRIYFDFSGYTDIAIGIGRLMGVRLPENFAAPYLKSNIALFWNSWHMTLTQWFRAYVFNPLTRRLRSAAVPPPMWLIILVTQASTMVLIGLWHGITWSFAAWGMWHAIGLFIHNRWVSLTANRLPAWLRFAHRADGFSGCGAIPHVQFCDGWLALLCACQRRRSPGVPCCPRRPGLSAGQGVPAAVQTKTPNRQRCPRSKRWKHGRSIGQPRIGSAT